MLQYSYTTCELVFMSDIYFPYISTSFIHLPVKDTFLGGGGGGRFLYTCLLRYAYTLLLYHSILSCPVDKLFVICGSWFVMCSWFFD